MSNLLLRVARLAVYLTVALLATAALTFSTDRAEVHDEILEHFKYGSIGSEERAGVPYLIWGVLPQVFPEHLPQRSGNGYERFGFVYEKDKPRPIGTSLRERQVPLIGLNCAVCHTGTMRDAPGTAAKVVLGMPAHQVNLQAYQRFLFASFTDARFTSGNIWAAMSRENPKLSWLDGLLYRWIVIPRTQKEGRRAAQQAAWLNSRPPQGPGRVDTFNPYKVMFNFDLSTDDSVGTADLPSLWNQKMRQGMWLHWDGNNNEVTERNKSAAIGAGCSEASLDLPSMKRVEEWIWTLPAPPFPRTNQIDEKRAAAGQIVYRKACADCHDAGGSRVGKVVALTEIGTDSERLRSFTPELASKMNTLGEGRPWKFTHFRKTDGYASMPLDGIWLRAPYLHNGSVPTLRHLLEPPEKRPSTFWRGYDVFDYKDVGFIWSGPDAERIGFRYDTGVKGNSNKGHLYGTDLPPSDKENLLEYLKTL